MRYLVVAVWIVVSVAGAVLVGWHYEDQAGAVMAGAAVGWLCGAAWGALAAVWAVRRPRVDAEVCPPMHHPTLILLDEPEISRGALEWNGVAHR